MEYESNVNRQLHLVTLLTAAGYSSPDTDRYERITPHGLECLLLGETTEYCHIRPQDVARWHKYQYQGTKVLDTYFGIAMAFFASSIPTTIGETYLRCPASFELQNLPTTLDLLGAASITFLLGLLHEVGISWWHSHALERLGYKSKGKQAIHDALGTITSPTTS